MKVLLDSFSPLLIIILIKDLGGDGSIKLLNNKSFVSLSFLRCNPSRNKSVLKISFFGSIWDLLSFSSKVFSVVSLFLIIILISLFFSFFGTVVEIGE